MQRIVVGIMTLFFLVGCQTSQPLPYAAGEEGAARFIRADYIQSGSKIQVILDASVYHVNSAHILRSNDQKIEPLAIQRPPKETSNFSTLGSIGGGAFQGGRFAGTDNQAIPSRPIESGGNTYQTKTYIWFNFLSLGDPPWSLELNVVGIGDLSIKLPAKVSMQDESMQTPTPKQAN
ncbi:MAG TPA: hypothetical protein DCM28_13910 [Phycisphaerales bacterium]|nr:hypothetical protein [Phycisphaerales bacterium]HCD34499.1 hypothetical protein [Phycisphaerales bacterium]|tara:strand:+ start:152101 stop:152631 length:531 start_codon:yes stop_codon:yes gene_type:complete